MMKRIAVLALMSVLSVAQIASAATPKQNADTEKAAADVVKTNANNAKIDADMELSMMQGSRQTFINKYAAWKIARMGVPPINPTVETMMLSVTADEGAGYTSYMQGNTDTNTANGQYNSAQSMYNMAGMEAPGALQDLMYNQAASGWILSSIGYGFAFIDWSAAGAHFDDARLGYEEMTAYLDAHP